MEIENIINKMHNTINDYSALLTDIIHQRQNIEIDLYYLNIQNKDNIENIEITKFKELCNEVDMVNTLKKINELKIKLVKNKQQNCVHSWTSDYIDLEPDISKKIVYCEICETNYD
jgi:hypothetical protein